MKNKTVMDAVNELKGDLSSVRKANGFDTDRFLHHLNHETQFGKKGDYVLYSCKNGNCTATYLCTSEEFNELVSLLSNNFDRMPLGLLEIWQERIKEVSKIDWDKAPEGATHYNPSKFAELCKYYKLTGGCYLYYFESEWRKSTATKKSLEDCLVTRKQPKPSPVDVLFDKINEQPVFTQAMKDNGELPPIGSYFIDIEYNTDKRVLAIAHDLPMKRVVYKSCNNDPEYFGAVAHECKPIDTRTDKEKACDDLMNSYWNPDNEKVSVHSPIVIKFINAIIDGKIHGVKWVGE